MGDRVIRTNWDTPACIKAVVTTREGGCSEGSYAGFNIAMHTGDNLSAVGHNRQVLSGDLGKAPIQWMEQVHGTAVFQCDTHTAQRTPQADAAWTDEVGIAIAVQTADCVPVLVADRRGTMVGAAHAGWRGLQRGVIESLVSQLPADAAELTAWIGPAIGVDHYEVGRDVWSHFVAEHRDALRPHSDTSEKRLLDLSRIAYNQLIRIGVGCVTQSRLCTYADDRFYSYRQTQDHSGGETGRFASLVMLLEQH